MNDALGLIEVIGYVAAIEAADAAGKAANVTLLGIEKVTGGIVTVKVTGDVAAVQAAVSAGARAAECVGTLRASHVIARLHEEVSCIVQAKVKDLEENKQVVDTLEEVIAIEVEEETEAEEAGETADAETEIEIEEIEGTEDNDIPEKVDEKTLSSMSVVELKKLAKSLAVPVTSKKLKTAKKEELIDMILKYCGEDKA